VDLLVSIAYTAAADQVLDEPLPIGMGLRVPVPDPKRCVPVPPVNSQWALPNVSAPAPGPTACPPTPDPDGLCEFDELGILEVDDVLLDK
jgi:ubiquitin-conjugating enzyme E2 Q